MTIGRWILGGWIVLIIAMAGLTLGFVLYTHVVIGVKLHDQNALLKLPRRLIVQARATQKAAITLKGRVDLNVPFKKKALALPLHGTYRANISLDTMVPLRMNIHYRHEIPVHTSMTFHSNTGLVIRWLPHFPLKGRIPLNIKVPVSLTVPVNTMIRFKYKGPVLITFNQTLHPSVDTVLHTHVLLDKAVKTPVTNTFTARIIPDKRELPVVLTDSLLQLPLRSLKLSLSPPEHPSR